MRCSLADGTKDKFDIIQEMIDTPIVDICPPRESSNFFFQNLNQGKLNLRELFKKGELNSKEDFKIIQRGDMFGLKFGEDNNI